MIQRVVFTIVAVLGLFSAPVYSEGFPLLKKASFELYLTSDDSQKDSSQNDSSQNNAIKQVLIDELKKQQKTHEQLKHLKNRRKIGRLESELLSTKLRSIGYYNAHVKVEIAKDKHIYTIQTGAAYRVTRITYDLLEGVKVDPLNSKLIREGHILDASAILNSVKYLQENISLNYCFFRVKVDYRVQIDHENQSAHVRFEQRDSIQVQFGEVNIQGLTSIKETFIRQYIDIKKGDCFKRKLVDNVRLSLIQSNLVANVGAEIGEPSDHQVPLNLHISERKHASVEAGLTFDSDDLAGVIVGWEHRNMFHRGLHLETDLYVAQRHQTFVTSISIPHYYRKNQRIEIYTEVDNEQTDAFDSKSMAVGAELSRTLTKYTRAELGGELEFAEVEEDEEDNYALISSPFRVEYDRRNNPLNPRKGAALSMGIQPYWDAYDTETQFTKTSFAASAYLSSDTLFARPVIAMRFAVGGISGEPIDDVPAHTRFYAGGGGSVRGYAYQTLGPLEDDEPTGGLSFNEVSIETRFQFGEHWGTAVFLDGGFAYESQTPTVGEDLRWGAGLGLRYYTSFAPIRIDVAFPLNQRDGLDDDFQIYLSIGQAF